MKAGDRLIAVAECKHESPRPEPCLSEHWQQPRRVPVRRDGCADVPHLLQGDAKTKICIGIARVDGDGLLERPDRLRQSPRFETSQSEIVLQAGTLRLQECGFL